MRRPESTRSSGTSSLILIVCDVWIVPGRGWPQPPFMTEKHRSVRSFALPVLDLLRFGTLRRVARYLGVGWDLVKDIPKSKLRLLYRSIPLPKVRYLGIDEFSTGKGHESMTVVTDLRTGRILHAVEREGRYPPLSRKACRKGQET